MQEMFRNWAEPRKEASSEVAKEGEDLYLIHRVLAEFPQAYAAVREAFRVRDAASRPVVLCSQCKCRVEEETKDGGG